MNFRKRVFNKISQTPSTTPATSTPPVQTPTLTALQAYPSLSVGFDSARVVIVNNIVKMLNTVSNIITNGKYNFQSLKDISFNFDVSQFTSPIKDILVFFKQVFVNLLNNGVNYTKPLTVNELNVKTNFLLSLPELQKFSQVNASGPIAQKIPNVYETLKNELIRLRPATVQ
jgi:hypothetical protein